MMYLDHETYDAIDREVYRIWMEYQIDALPFDVAGLAAKMGFSLRAFSSFPKKKREDLLRDESLATGFHVCDQRSGNPRFVICYNDDDDPARWRFTIAHEIAHIVLGHGSNPTKKQEAEADCFAKQLLAPRCLSQAMGVRDPLSIKKTFGLSWEAACYEEESIDNKAARFGDRVLPNDAEFIEWAKQRRWFKKR